MKYVSYVIASRAAMDANDLFQLKPTERHLVIELVRAAGVDVSDWSNWQGGAAKAALPYFQKAKSGHFINISSVAGIKVFAPGGSVYSATKFAVRALSEGLRVETRKDNIRVTILSPGFVDSELKEGSSDEASSRKVKDSYKFAIPADSIARAIAYAIEQPADVEVDEIVVRPTVQDF
jgi:NADP-dependent 3-hydroxy acid dehydrogenase YdfG